MAGDPFTSAIFGWLNRVVADDSLPPRAFKLAYVISQHINRNSHVAWPGQETLAEAIGLPAGANVTRTVRRLTDALVAGGHLIARQRRQTSMVYRLAAHRAEIDYGAANDIQTGAEHRTGAEEEQTRPDIFVRSENQDRTFLTARPDISGHQDRTKMSAKPLKEPLKEPERESAPARRLPDDFRLDDQTHNWALGLLGSNDAVQQSMFRFENHYRSASGDKAKSPDWQAKARIWIDDDARKPRQKPDKSVHGAINRLISSFDAGPNGGPIIDSLSDASWEGVLSTFKRMGIWTKHVAQCGEAPPSPKCRAPRHLLEKFGITIDDKEAAA